MPPLRHGTRYAALRHTPADAADFLLLRRHASTPMLMLPPPCYAYGRRRAAALRADSCCATLQRDYAAALRAMHTLLTRFRDI